MGGGHMNHARAIRVIPGTSQPENWCRVRKNIIFLRKTFYPNYKGDRKDMNLKLPLLKSLSNGEADLGTRSWKIEVELWMGNSASELKTPWCWPSLTLLWTQCVNQQYPLFSQASLSWPLWVVTKQFSVKPYSMVNNLPRSKKLGKKNVLPVELLLCSSQCTLVWMKLLSSYTFLSMTLFFVFIQNILAVLGKNHTIY